MPDPTKVTISATEMPMLLGVSPYGTKWMLYQKFAKGVDLPSTTHNRMDWGSKLEPLILTPEAFNELIRHDYEKYKKVVAAVGVRIDK